MAQTHRFSVSVAGAVFRDDGQVLVIQREDNGHWEPPGGVLEPGESFEQALRREVLEETGYIVQADHLTGVYQNLKRDIVALVYRCTVQAGQPTPSHETTRVRWVEPSAIPDVMDEAYAVRILDAAALTSHAVTRSHDGVSIVTTPHQSASS